MEAEREYDKNIEQRQAKWRNFYQASGERMLLVCDNRFCKRNIRSEINYCLGNRALVVSLPNLVDLQAGMRGEGIVFGLKRATVADNDRKVLSNLTLRFTCCQLW
jgi:hypothetical protein